MHKIAQSAGCGLAPLPRTCRARVAGLRGGARGGARQQLQQCAIARYGREQGASVAWVRLLRRGRGRRGPRAAGRRP